MLAASFFAAFFSSCFAVLGSTPFCQNLFGFIPARANLLEGHDWAGAEGQRLLLAVHPLVMCNFFSRCRRVKLKPSTIAVLVACGFADVLCAVFDEGVVQCHISTLVCKYQGCG